MSKRLANEWLKVKDSLSLFENLQSLSLDLVEFCWFQANPSQSFRLRMTEKQFLEAQKYIHSKSNSNEPELID